MIAINPNRQIRIRPETGEAPGTTAMYLVQSSRFARRLARLLLVALALAIVAVAFLPWQQTAGPNQVPPDFSWVSNSCGGKAAIGVFGGGIMGLLMGVFLGALSDATPPVQVIGGKDVPQAPLKEQARVTMRATWEKSLYWCRNFAFITGVFGGTDCLVEKYRGKHDVWNSVASGCITGAALQAKQGPQAAALGCGGFAVFSLAIEQVMGHY